MQHLLFYLIKEKLQGISRTNFYLFRVKIYHTLYSLEGIILKVFDSKGSEMSSNINLHEFYIVVGYDKTTSKRYSTKVVLQ
ncbi:hypothetical protein GCM10022397_14530 [Flavivirga jejuensis]